MGKIIRIKGHNSRKVEEAVSVWKKETKNDTDILGSYTGRPTGSKDGTPEQDADDL